MRSAILEVKGLSKRFGGLTAVAGLEFSIYPGEILGLIGPNGAGKSTTFNLIAGAYAADAGTVPHHVAGDGDGDRPENDRPFDPAAGARPDVSQGVGDEWTAQHRSQQADADREGKGIDRQGRSPRYCVRSAVMGSMRAARRAGR